MAGLSRLSIGSILLRAFLLLAIAGGAAWLLFAPFRAIRREAQVKNTLLTIQQALQAYHVKEELYPLPYKMKGAQLVDLLLESGHLKAPPLNPYSGAPYGHAGNETADRIYYETDSQQETYSLKALNFENDETFLLIDSTEHHSLE